MTELEKALITIREECKKHDVCTTCPLRTNTTDPNPCYVKSRKPEYYHLVIDDDTSGRVFSD